VNTRSTQATGTTVTEALAAGLARLLGCEPSEVELQLSAPGLDGVSGRVELSLEVDASTQERPDQEPADEPAAGQPPVVQSTDEWSRDERTGFDDEDEGSPDEDLDLLDEEADAGADFLEGLLDALDLPGDLRIRAEADHAVVEVLDVGSGALIGRRGQTLEAIQELLRCALQREFQRRARVMVDVEGYRARRLEKLLEKAEEAIDAVLDTGEPERLEPMDVFERKAVHHLVAEVDGLISRSQGREPARRIVIERE
jgi:spoIIIJ-associated protein